MNKKYLNIIVDNTGSMIEDDKIYVSRNIMYTILRNLKKEFKIFLLSSGREIDKNEINKIKIENTENKDLLKYLFEDEESLNIFITDGNIEFNLKNKKNNFCIAVGEYADFNNMKLYFDNIVKGYNIMNLIERLNKVNI